MPISTRQFLVVVTVCVAACALAGCGTINEKLANGMGDYIPAWAGGLPADAPPRPGSAKYDEYMRQREQARLSPAVERVDPAKASSQDAVH